MADNFFAILTDESIRKIIVTTSVYEDMESLFALGSSVLISNKSEEVFDGENSANDDEISFVEMELPPAVAQVAENSIGVQPLNLKNDEIKALFWYNEGEYYFQNFDRRKLLRNKNVLFFDKNTFDQLMDDAFIVDNVVHAVFKNGRFYFESFANANRVFSLTEHFREATEEELATFSENSKISIPDRNWLLEKSSTVIRKQITFLTRSGILDSLDVKKIKKGAKKFKLEIAIDPDGKLIIPCDSKGCRNVLYYLNEQYYVGEITSSLYRTNAKKRLS